MRAQPLVITMTYLRANVSEVVNIVHYGDQEVIVTSNKKPRVRIVPIPDEERAQIHAMSLAEPAVSLEKE